MLKFSLNFYESRPAQSKYIQNLKKIFLFIEFECQTIQTSLYYQALEK